MWRADIISITYPAIFSKEVDGYTVYFPDLDGCQTEGDTIDEAVEVAKEALGLFLVSLEERKIIANKPSNPRVFSINYSGFLAFISCEIEKFRRNKNQ